MSESYVSPPPGVYQPPQSKPSTPTVIGVLNIVFGGILIIWGFFALMQYIVMPHFFRFLDSSIQQSRQEMLEDRQQQIEELKAEERAATTEEEREMLRQEIRDLEAMPDPAVPDMSKMMPQSNSGIMAWGISFESVGVLLNLAMIASGVGLLLTRPWGRTLALWVAGLKIARLVVGHGIYMLVCIPPYVEQMKAMMGELDAAGPGQGPPPGAFDTFGPMMGIMLGVQSVVIIVFGSVYPALVLWLLNTARVRAFFRDRGGPV